MKDSGYRMALKREADRERSWRKSRQGAFESSMLSLDEHVAKFDDPGKIAAFSDGVRGAARVRLCDGCEAGGRGVVDPEVKKRMLNKLRKHPHLQKTLRRFIKNATSRKRRPVKKTHIEKICEILFRPINTRVCALSARMEEPFSAKSGSENPRFKT